MPIPTIIERGKTWAGASPGFNNGSGQFNNQNIWEVIGRDARYVVVMRFAYGNGTGPGTTFPAFYKTIDDINFSVLDFSHAPQIGLPGDSIAVLCDKRVSQDIVSFAGYDGLNIVNLGQFDLNAETYGTTVSVTGSKTIEPSTTGAYIKLIRLSDNTHLMFYNIYKTDLDGTFPSTNSQTYNTLFVSYIDSGGIFHTGIIIDQVKNPNPYTLATTGWLTTGSFCLDTREMVHFGYALSTFQDATCEIKYCNVLYNGGGLVTIGTPVSMVKTAFSPPPLSVRNNASGNQRGLYYAPQDKVFLPHLFSTGGLTVVSGSWPKNISMITVTGATTSPIPTFEGISDIAVEPVIGSSTVVWPSVWLCGTTLNFAVQAQGSGTSPQGGTPSTRTRIWTRAITASTWVTPGTDWWIWSSNPPNAGNYDSTFVVQDATFPDMQSAAIKNGAAVANIWAFDTFDPSNGEVDVCLYYIFGPPSLPCGGITLACPIPPPAFGAFYSAFLIVTGGTPPFTFAIISGALPAGLTLNAATGQITGFMANNNPWGYTAQVTDANGLTATTTCFGGGTGPPIPPCPAASVALIGQPFSLQLVDPFGVPPITWVIVAGSLPPGLTLNGATGLISGTPTMAGSFTYTAQATDSLGSKFTLGGAGGGGCPLNVSNCPAPVQ